MTDKHDIGEIVAKTFAELEGEAKPGASFKHVKPDLDRVGPAFLTAYDGKPVSGDKLEDTFGKVADSYIKSLWGMPPKGANAANMVRGWLGLVSEQAYGQVKNAIKEGNKAEVLKLLNQAYEAQANKLTTIITKLREQPSDVQLGVYKILADKMGGSLAKVATGLPQAISTYGQTLAAQEAYK